MTAETLQASQLEHRDHVAAVEDYYRRGWTDGLPVTDVVIAGFGGCGSCRTRTIRDAMELEWAGVPSVALVHEDMLPAVDAMTRLADMPDYPYVVVGRTRTSLCDWDDATVAAVAKEIAGEAMALLDGTARDGTAAGRPAQ